MTEVWKAHYQKCRCGRRGRIFYVSVGSALLVALGAATDAFSCWDRAQAAYIWMVHQQTLATDLANAQKELHDAEIRIGKLEHTIDSLKKKHAPQSPVQPNETCGAAAPRRGLFGEILGGIVGDER